MFITVKKATENDDLNHKNYLTLSIHFDF